MNIELTNVLRLLQRVEATLAQAGEDERLCVLFLLHARTIAASREALAQELQRLREPIVKAFDVQNRHREEPTPTQAAPADAYLTEREVAELLRVSVSGVRKWRLQRTGPRFVKIGRLVRYHRRDDGSVSGELTVQRLASVGATCREPVGLRGLMIHERCATLALQTRHVPTP